MYIIKRASIPVKITVTFSIIVVIVIAMGAGILWSKIAAEQAQQEQQRAETALASFSDVMNALINQEVAVLEYAVTQDEAALGPYQAGYSAMEAGLADSAAAVGDYPEMQEDLQVFASLVEQWQESALQPIIAATREGNPERARALIEEGHGRSVMDDIRDRMTAIETYYTVLESDLMDRRDAAMALTQSVVLIASGLAIAMALGLGVLLSRAIATPIRDMTQSMESLAKGDTSVEIPGRDRGDEIGLMAAAVTVFRDTAIERETLEQTQAAERERERKRSTELDSLNGALKSEAGDVVETVAAGAERLQENAQTVSAMAEELSAQSATVAAGAEQASTNVRTVAAAAEELSSAIAEVAQSAGRSSRQAGETSAMADEAGRTMDELSAATGRVDSFVAVVSDIAEKTNLLALNATIEAARAGDAGKGFAVVAAEVKNLAKQTADATDQITREVGAISSATKKAAEAFLGVSSRIQEIDASAASIAASVEEQQAATREIARNVQEAATGTQSVTETISETKTAAAETGNAASEMLGQARELTTQSTELNQALGRYLRGVASL